jgi:hypothetical protein
MPYRFVPRDTLSLRHRPPHPASEKNADRPWIREFELFAGYPGGSQVKTPVPNVSPMLVASFFEVNARTEPGT